MNDDYVIIETGVNNHIRWEVLEGKIVLTTVIAGRDLSWINFDKDQMDNLITELQSARKTMEE